MNQLRFLCAQPAIPYYIWQVEVMINNFLEMGVNPNQIHILCAVNDNKIPEKWKTLSEGYKDVSFFFYNDARFNRNYTSSIRPNIIKEHFNQNTYLEGETIFYHDCDIVFTKPISEWITDEMINDNNWYGSDCRWYLSHSYIKSKGDDVLNTMCNIVGISSELVEKNELNTIGAQYILKNINSDFWQKIENDSEQLFTSITKLSNTKKIENPNYHELQIWCADMWALLWNAWRDGKKTICHPNLEFSWGTSDKKLWYENNIFHNAGVTSNEGGYFYKSDFINELPYNRELNIDENTASYNYWQMIKNVSKKTILF